ncbi:hypothetical protein A2U01_0059523, partial [Trifolium medium]|nr:hypothetical protein [Trifolium medium]
ASVSCASRRQEWRGAPVIKDGKQDGIGLLRVARIHVARRTPSCVHHARCAGKVARRAAAKSIYRNAIFRSKG